GFISNKAIRASRKWRIETDATSRPRYRDSVVGANVAGTFSVGRDTRIDAARARDVDCVVADGDVIPYVVCWRFWVGRLIGRRDAHHPSATGGDQTDDVVLDERTRIRADGDPSGGAEDQVSPDGRVAERGRSP